MCDQQQPEPTGTSDAEEQVVVVGPDGQPIGTIPASALPAMTEAPGDGDGEDDDGERHITELVEQPAKVMRIGSMIRQLLEEVKAAPLDEASRNRLKDIHAASIKELFLGSDEVSGWAVFVKTDDSSAQGRGYYWLETLSTLPDRPADYVRQRRPDSPRRPFHPFSLATRPRRSESSSRASTCLSPQCSRPGSPGPRTETRKEPTAETS